MVIKKLNPSPVISNKYFFENFEIEGFKLLNRPLNAYKLKQINIVTGNAENKEPKINNELLSNLVNHQITERDNN